MELFTRRYLCFFSFVFLFVSAVATLLGGFEKTVLLISLVLLAVAACLLTVFLKKRRFAAAVTLTALIFSAVALFNSLFFITLPQSRADRYIGENVPARVSVLSCEYSDENTSEYLVRIEQIGDDELDILSYLYCDFPSTLDYGDMVICTFDIAPPVGYESDRKDVLLVLNAVENAPVYYKEAATVNYLSVDGIARMCKGLRDGFCAYVDGIYGDAVAPLVKGFLINDKSDIPSAVQTDFKRSGTTHLLAVSGLHITLLLGSIELLLKKLYVSKRIRCVTVAVLAVLLLALTNFSASAVRAVFMLYAVYLSFLFYEDHDTVTALFVSVALITLISPFSVYDIGMWMSFLATLGLVTVYAYLDRRLPRVKTKNLFGRVTQKLGLSIARAVLITLVANFFLVPIMWFFFGEISLAAIPANLLLTPIVAVFMPLCAIGVVIGAIPFLNGITVYVTEMLEKAILYITDTFADARGAVLSLRYPFVPWLVIAFSIALAVMLVIKLKHKLLICLPPAIFVLSFCVCLTVFANTTEPEIRYSSYRNSDMVFIDSWNESTVCDITNGGYSARTVLFADMSDCATEIDNYVITHPHKYHAASLRQILSSIYIRTLYLPITDDPDDILYVKDVYKIAKEYDTDTVFYKSGGKIEILDGKSLNVHFEDTDGYPTVFITLGDSECVFTYTDASESKAAIAIGAQSRYFLIGEHGYPTDGNLHRVEISEDTRVIFASQERFDNTAIVCQGEQGYIIRGDGSRKKIRLPLH